MADKNIFYLKEVFPEADKIFSSKYSSVEQIKDECLFVLDTNILFVPFDTSEKSLKAIGEIFKSLKKKNRLFLPARVAREFAKNRGKNIGNLFLKIRQKKNGLNSGNFKIEDYPLLENNNEFIQLKDKFKAINKLISESRQIFNNIENHILSWNWDDPVSNIYSEIFTPEIVIEMKKEPEELKKDLKFRIEHKIPPGFKDSGKLDDGVGDLIVWQTVLEIGKENDKNVILVSDDQKNDWFYKQDKMGVYPRFELFDEFRRFTNGNSIAIINFPQLLEMFDAAEDIVVEVEKSIRAVKMISDIESIESLRLRIHLGLMKFIQTKMDTGAIPKDKRFGNVVAKSNYLLEKGFFSIYFHNLLVEFYRISDLAAKNKFNFKSHHFNMGKEVLDIVVAQNNELLYGKDTK